MQINKDILFGKDKKIAINYNPKSPNNSWFQNLIDNFPKISFQKPKKNLGKAK
jgi:hypothetical protein